MVRQPGLVNLRPPLPCEWSGRCVVSEPGVPVECRGCERLRSGIQEGGQVSNATNETSGYNGWANKETWLVALWLDNDPGSERACRELALELRQVHRVADALRDQVEDGNPLLEPGQRSAPSGLYLDLLLTALGHVAWDAVARHVCTGAGMEEER